MPEGLKRPFLDRLLIGACAFTLLTTAYLSLSVLALRPPRLNDGAWALTASLFVAHSALTLLGITGVWRSRAVRVLLIPGSVVLIAAGAWSAWSTLNDEHFEGYALILGVWVVIQGVLTLLRLRPGGDRDVVPRPA